jgi:predicted DNA-binding WGR domain protein
MNQVWINDSMRRYYRVIFQTYLFGHLVMVRSWGSLDSNRGQMRSELISNKQHGMDALNRIGKTRRHRGYRLVSQDKDAGLLMLLVPGQTRGILPLSQNGP